MRVSEPQRDVSGDVTGLRSSLNDLSLAHSGAVAAINRRLDRIEVKVGLTTDMTSSVSDPAAVGAPRRAAKQAKKQPRRPPIREADAAQSVARPERGHMFNLKPISQQGAPLRMSRLPG